MSNLKTSQLGASSTLSGSELVEVVQSGQSKQSTAQAIANLAPLETTTTIGTLINGATSKSTPVDADYLPLMDSAASNVVKKLSWANVKATMMAFFSGYATTATAAGTTTLTVASPYSQFFTGTTTQTVIMPVTSTLAAGQQFRIVNNSTGTVTVNSSGANAIVTMIGGATAVLTCILTSGTTAASWGAMTVCPATGPGSSGGFTVGALVASTINALTQTAQSIGFTIAGGTTSKTLTVPLDASISGTHVAATGKTFTCSNTLTLAGTDGTTMTFPSTSVALCPVAGPGSGQAFATGAQTITGNCTTTGALIAGTPTDNGLAKLQTTNGITLGNGVLVGSTKKVLDAYDEGLWTPVLQGITVVGTLTTTGHYTRIGRRYFCTLTLSAVTSITTFASTSYVPLPQAGSVTDEAVSTVKQDGTYANVGGVIKAGENIFYPGVFATTAGQKVTMSFSYEV